VFSAISALTLVSAISACGQKGPPLPPIVRTPVAPGLTADRRGADVELTVTAPAANADGSRPANVTRVDVFAVNGATPGMTDLDIVKKGTRVASVPVKTLRDPSDAVEKGESADEAGETVGPGLDQGASTSITEAITPSVLAGAEDGGGDASTGADADAGAVLLGPPGTTELRTYLGVSVDRRGRRGQFSRRVAVPLQLPPPPPPPIAITYTEKKIVITWKPEVSADLGNVLPSHPFGPLTPDVSYNLYDAATGQLVNPKPVRENGYEDTRMDFGTKRCYVVRAVTVVAGSPVESDATGPTCVMLVDTFPPGAPKGLKAVATTGAISLIWDANTEPDLAGYYVLRGTGADGRLERITPMPIADASYVDNVQTGQHVVYAVEAVDRAGNVSPAGDRVEETAR
jgi:predicted small lipoprotein YifL